MNSPHEIAVKYLQVSRSDESFWRWDDDTCSIIWVDGSTVASRQEIAGILRRLAPHELPPIGVIAHLFAACRGKQLSINWGKPTEDEIRNQRIPHVASSCGVHY